MNVKYGKLRLWLHYFWIFTFEFGTVLVYGVLILALRWRIRSNYYQTQEQQRYATQAAKLMVAFPIVYVLCTLPLATMRMYQETTSKHRVNETWFCFAGAMITSNGWLDVLLYSLTRRIMLFSDEPPTADNGIESFGTPWMKRDIFGTETTCEHIPTTSTFPLGHLRRHDRKGSDTVYIVDTHHSERTKDFGGHVAIATELTVEITSAPMTDEQRRVAERGYHLNNNSKRGLEAWSSDGASSGKSDGSRPMSPASLELEIEGLEFNTKPAGF